MEPTNPYDLLTRDAKRILSILRRLEDTSAGEPDRRRSIVAELRSALERRQRVQDRHLYPLLSTTHAADEAVAIARAQQERAFERLAQLERTSPDTADFGLLAASLSSELRLHLEHDQKVVLREAELNITEEQEEQIAEAMQEESEV